MKEMKELTDMKGLREKMSTPGFHLFYLSRPAGGVCTVLKAKVLELLKEFPSVKSYYINLDLVPEGCGTIFHFYDSCCTFIY